MGRVGGVLAVLVVVGLTVLVPSPAYACSCTATSLEQSVRGADVIVHAQVVSHDVESPDGVWGGSQPSRTELLVDRVFRGQVHEHLTLVDAGRGACPGPEPEVGQRNVMLLSGEPRADGDLDWHGFGCGWSQPLTVGAITELVGEGRAPLPDNPATRASGAGVPLPALVVGGLAALLAGAWLVRRRRPVGT
jgi:hypothetical protein